ncbi:hypothetical protein KXW98_008311 [Aspergillus fumigatus]|uniref:Uncharacterized protein n=1 Tax=Aspergillus fumigatus TaxID=746128 RepID=A0A9P8NB40_ASPFM|nr:hypothetical protein KXX45_007589 [Aspergillus fumigatus]KAH1286907.1 hypothetical protein KXX30_008818 [Aspergillus fumigatus]KAH1308984.1 hypothetical protein KXX66_001209 [Aspergillus fumigatus]KAH1316590.1 hypothetical protein KXX47_003193 [Aspergillus fumigatus]KAH1338583.1 hypothetical protein KXX67_000391 [Aspergillus fumigatus]
MAARVFRNTPNPLLIPEIVGLVVDNIHTVPDLLNCACVNIIWNLAALKKLYRGSLNDMQFRTPDIGSLNCLFVASRKRFVRNMSFVRHLLLCPESPAIDEAAQPDTRLACVEKCRAMRHREYAEHLLRPRGSGLASLSIPFQIMDQDWSQLSDLLLTPTVEFLAIDNYYCKLLMASYSYSRELTTPTDKFSNLKALTIYKSDSYLGIDELCELLKSCDLEFFHIESDNAEPVATQLLPYLRRQLSLRALALNIPCCGLNLGSKTPAREEQGDIWPRVKALYLQEGDQHWLEQLPKLTELQILSLRKLASGSPTINQSAIENVAKCRNLRVVDLVLNELDDVELLLNIADGCPLLQKFSVWPLGLRVDPGAANSLLSRLLRALPRLEFLALALECQMDGAILQDLARHCPQLTVLELPQTQLLLSLSLMTKTSTLRHLESMHLAGIYFRNPRRMMQCDKIRSIAREWRRIFPKIRGMPCTADVYSRYMSDDYSSEGSGDEVSVSSDEEVPELGFNDYDSVWFILRTKLWRCLGYPKDQFIHDRIQNMWQTDLEIKTIGWPVMPLKAFADPDLYSTAAHGVR